jgi:hypothetical protein
MRSVLQYNIIAPRVNTKLYSEPGKKSSEAFSQTEKRNQQKNCGSAGCGRNWRDRSQKVRFGLSPARRQEEGVKEKAKLFCSKAFAEKRVFKNDAVVHLRFQLVYDLPFCHNNGRQFPDAFQNAGSRKPAL